MRRNPIPGVLEPHMTVRITPHPSIDPTELAIVLSRSGQPGYKAVSLTPDGDSVILRNLTDSHAPYLLVIVDREAHTTWGRIYHHVRAYLEKTKVTQ